MDGGAWKAAVYGVAETWTRLSNFTFTFHFHALEKAMATHSSVFAWRIPGMEKPGGLPSMGSHRVRHNWSDLAAAAADVILFTWVSIYWLPPEINCLQGNDGPFFFFNVAYLATWQCLMHSSCSIKLLLIGWLSSPLDSETLGEKHCPFSCPAPITRCGTCYVLLYIYI